MGDSPHKDPLDIATGLHELSRFLKSAGFPQAAALVELASQSAAMQIERVRAKTEGRIKAKRAQTRSGRSADVIALGPRRAEPHKG